MQPAPTANSATTALGAKRKELASATYQTSFANRDMAVNMKYARYLERFGSGNPAARDEQQEQLQPRAAQRRIEDNKVDDNRSPDLADDMMMESTGMQRSSAKFSPQRTAKDRPASGRNEEL